MRAPWSWSLVGVLGALLGAAPASAALPEPGFWSGSKQGASVSFTIRADGDGRRMTDVVTSCGSHAYLDGIGHTPPSYAVPRDGVVKLPPVTIRARLGKTTGRFYAGVQFAAGGARCEKDAIPVTRGDFRPIQDGLYRASGGLMYDLTFRVVGGGAMISDFSGRLSIPDPTSLTGHCGTFGNLGDDTRLPSDGSFVFKRDNSSENYHGEITIRGAVSGTGAAAGATGSYTYSADRQCVGGGPVSTTIDWAATLAEAAPDAAPTGEAPAPPGELPDAPGAAPDAPDPKPLPNNGYPGAPTPSSAAGCTPTLSVGPIAALAACFRTRGEAAQSAGRVRLNGIDLTPANAGGTISINRRSGAISSSGPVEVRLGSLSLLRAPLRWTRPESVFAIAGRSKDFTTGGQALFGLPVEGAAKLRLEGGRTKLTVSLKIPKDGGGVSRLSGYSGELTAAADNTAGLILDGAKIAFPGMRFGFVEIQSASLAVAQTGGTYHFDGGATVFPFRFTRVGIQGELGFGLGDGYFRLAAAAENLNRPLVYGFFLQKVGVSAQFNPFGVGGAAAVSFGPQIRLGGDLVSAARLDGSMSYVSADGGDPASLTLAGALELVEAKVASGQVTIAGDGSVSAKGEAEFGVGDYGLSGEMEGWFDGQREFNVEGSAELKLPGVTGSGDAILSSRGIGACRRGDGPDVGFGYTWGKGAGGVSLAAGSCSLGTWRAVRGAAARAAQAGGGTVSVKRGLRQLAVQVTGAGGAPTVAVTAPDGRRIDPLPAGQAVLDATTYFAADPTTSATYLIVDRPAAGRWRIEPLEGSVPVTGVRTAAPLPTVTASGSVRRRGDSHVLTYRVRGLEGRRVQLVDTAGPTHKALRTIDDGRGRVRFAPAARGGAHRIIGRVLSAAGLPTGRTVRVASFRARATGPGAPRRVRVRVRGTSRLVTWRGPASLRYEVDVRTGDGRRLLLLPQGRSRSVTVGMVPRGVRVRATVRGRDASGRAGRAVTARG
jgi:hypothetical protein